MTDHNDPGVRLVERFNAAIAEQYPDGSVSAEDCLVAAGTILIGYICDVPDVEWKRDKLDMLTAELRDKWKIEDRQLRGHSYTAGRCGSPKCPAIHIFITTRCGQTVNATAFASDLAAQLMSDPEFFFEAKTLIEAAEAAGKGKKP